MGVPGEISLGAVLRAAQDRQLVFAEEHTHDLDDSLPGRRGRPGCGVFPLMATVRFPNGQAIRYNNLNFVTWNGDGSALLKHD